MGRKSRAKHSVKPPCISAYSNKKEVDRMIQKLLNVCVKPTTKKDEWENYMEIQFLVERIRQYQNNDEHSSENRAKKLSEFLEWLQNNDVVMKDVAIENYGEEYGFGLKATTDIKVKDEIIRVPYKVMMTSDKATESYLDDFVRSRKMLTEMPNVSLALYLHCERHNPNSFYKPYIDILPSEYNTTLYFSPKEMELLKGTASLSVAISHYKSIARQYGMFFNLMHGDKIVPEVKKIPLSARNEFTFDAYRWAVSTVSTRLNRIAIIQSEASKQEVCQHDGQCHGHTAKDTTLALIPLWDMVNHTDGQISTDCDPKESMCMSYAMQDFQKDEQVKIFYGARSNTGFLVYNGFVAESNPYDRVEIQLGVSPNDKLYKKKTQLLEKLRIKPSGSFHIYAMTDNWPTSPELLAFLRVFLMKEVELDTWFLKGILGPGGLREIYSPSATLAELDMKVWKFLENRVELLLRGLKRTAQNQDEALSQVDLSDRTKLVVRLHKETIRVLEACHKFCHNFPLNPYSLIHPVSGKLLTEIPQEEETATSIIKEELDEGGERDTEVDISVLSDMVANTVNGKLLTEIPQEEETATSIIKEEPDEGGEGDTEVDISVLSDIVANNHLNANIESNTNNSSEILDEEKCLISDQETNNMVEQIET